ncbi:MAG TPA: Na+/H+ antiporter [Miltoncostaeaceae bacterium]|nr:Na+/H+ antiporter [Miltoncostaeaceae bacterium]
MHATMWAVLGLSVGVLLVEGFAGRVRVPAPILLVFAGVGASLIPGVPDYGVNPELVLLVLLPPLLYAAALQSSALAMRTLWRSVVGLAVGLVVVTTVLVGLVLHFLIPEIPLPVAFALGAVVAPPDAVAATAIARRVGLSRRVVTVLEGESLFDDAAALVLLKVSVAGISAGAIQWEPAVAEFAWATVGGLAFGALVGVAISWARRQMPGMMPTVALSLCAPFVSYLVAEQANSSGVLAVVVTGLIVAHRRSADVDAQTRITEAATWGALQFLLEGIVFGLIGLQLIDIVQSIQASRSEVLLALGGVLGTVLIVRIAWLFVGHFTARWLSFLRPRLTASETAVISWAGMRGVVSLAAAQTLPASTPARPLLILCAVGVIFATLVVQGLTLPAFIRWVKAPRRDPRAAARARNAAQERATAAVLRRIDLKERTEDLPSETADYMRELAMMREWRGRTGEGDDIGDTVRRRRDAMKRIIAMERTALLIQRRRGQLADHVLRDMEIDLDLEEALFARDQPATHGGHLDVLHSGTTDDESAAGERATVSG